MRHARACAIVVVLVSASVVLTARAAQPDRADGQATPATGLEAVRAYLEIDERLSTGGQITYDQIPALESAGVDVVINLAVADEERNGREGFLVTERGLTYTHIPVSWQEPSLEHLRQFFEVMEANRDRKVFVHCFANMRVSAFTYLYRTIELGVPEDEARTDLEKIWDPFTDERFPQWRAFIETAQREMR